MEGVWLGIKRVAAIFADETRLVRTGAFYEAFLGDITAGMNDDLLTAFVRDWMTISGRIKPEDASTLVLTVERPADAPARSH